ncbi:MAG TPA: DUF1080 domain-containing protein [Planctomycetota bacterium]|jgi:hypothetical protein
MRLIYALALAVILPTFAVAPVRGEDAPKPKPKVGYKDTPMLPGGKWHVHDSDRPQAPAVDPGSFSTPETPGKPPSDAIILFDGTDLSKWQSGNGGPAAWKVENGYAESTPGKGNILTKEQFGDVQLHIEWAAPDPPTGDIMNRGNSGVIFFGKYEIQVFDSYQGGIYADGQAASIYGQYPPLVNASRKPGQWQVYDIIFTAPKFKDGKLDKPAYVTVLHNGVLVHNHTEILGAMAHRALPKYTEHPPKGPLLLQEHGNAVRYRNIWIRPIKDYEDQ